MIPKTLIPKTLIPKTLIPKTLIPKTIVKFSHPDHKYGYQDLGGVGQSPGNTGEWGDYRFEFNTEIEECDYWVIYESVPWTERVRIPENRTIFVPSEPEIIRSYAASYLRQFDWIATSRRDFEGDNILRTCFMVGWWIKKTYDQMKNEPIDKTGTISILGSDVVDLASHRKRFAFLNRLIGHFKDRVDVFGSIDGAYWRDKYSALAPYRYSVIIENGQLDDYWTEKLADCLLCETMPLYAGCPNITDYFNGDSFIPIDLDDYRASIRAIEEAIETDAYTRHHDALTESKQTVLDKLQFFPWVIDLVTANADRLGAPSAKKRVELTPASKRMGVNEHGEERSFIT